MRTMTTFTFLQKYTIYPDPKFDKTMILYKKMIQLHDADFDFLFYRNHIQYFQLFSECITENSQVLTFLAFLEEIFIELHQVIITYYRAICLLLKSRFLKKLDKR